MSPQSAMHDTSADLILNTHGNDSVYLRCSVRLSNSQDVSLIQRVLMTLVLRLITNDGFSFDSGIACSEFFRVSWINRW